MEAISDAADVPAATVYRLFARQRQQGKRVIAKALARAAALRPDLNERAAADVIHACSPPSSAACSSSTGGLRHDRYQRWLTDLLTGQLLAVPPA